MKKSAIIALILLLFSSTNILAQKSETVYLETKDSTTNFFIAVRPIGNNIDSFLFLLDGFGNSPKDLLKQTEIPQYAASKNILTIIPLLKTGPQYFGSDAASQQSLKEIIEFVVKIYDLKGKPFYIGGFSIGGTCAVKYAELAVQHNYPIKPKAVFGIDPPLDWQRFYTGAKRVVRLANGSPVNGEVTYMIERIQKEMGGTPEQALNNYYNNSPYSFSDTTQRAIRSLLNTPIRIIAEPDIQWWLGQRGYDYMYINTTDHAAMINELQKLGNKNAVLVTTTNKGFRQPGNNRHPHSWSIADAGETVDWLLSQK